MPSDRHQRRIRLVAIAVIVSMVGAVAVVLVAATNGAG